MTSSTDEEFQRARSALETGQLAEAERRFRALLKARPKDVTALNLLGIVLARLGRVGESVTIYDQAVALAPSSGETWFNRGLALIAGGRLNDAIASLDRVLEIRSDFGQAQLLRAKLLTDVGRHLDALAAIDKLLASAPNLAEGWLGRSNVLFEIRRHDEALAACERALALKPGLAEAWLARGNALDALERHDESLAAYDRALALNPRLIGAAVGRGNVLGELGRPDEALATYDRALAAAPGVAEIWLGRGNVLNALARPQEALAAFDRALALARNLFEAWLGRGNALLALGRYDEASAAYDKALAINPDFVEAWVGRGNVCDRLKRHRQAAEAYASVLRIDPRHPFMKGLLLHQKMLACDWPGTADLIAEIDGDIAAGKRSAEPFGWQAVARSPRSLQLCAELYNAAKYPAAVAVLPSGPPRKSAKIRIGYSSGEFREQATSHLIVGVLEQHDHSRFEIHAVDNGGDDGSEIRRRINAAVSGVIDIRQLSDAAAAAAVRDKNIDILVNLNGYFGAHRTHMFAHRPAPIQVNYLGFPGTLGASYIDYIIADRQVIPESDQAFYSEKVVYLPNCYQANDRKKPIAPQAHSRGGCGLPENGVVFCCFNNPYKIVPELFGCWMRILSSVDGSALWLLDHSRDTTENLKREAAARNVNPERLVFAKQMPLAQHLARQRLADLFLDTLPYNAHTTASDALWAGLPVLTCRGETFPGRVAASLLKAVGLPELVTTSLAAYEAAAIGLASDAEKLAAVKRKLADNRLVTPLFDTGLFTKHLEAAYEAVYERYHAGLAPDRIDIAN